MWRSADFCLKETNSFLARRLARLLYLLAGICRLGTNQQLSSPSFVFVNSWRGEEDSRVPTALMAVLMPLMCDLGQQRRDLPKHSILNYYQSCTADC